MSRKILVPLWLLLAIPLRLAAMDVLLSELAVMPAAPPFSAAVAELNAGSAVSRLLQGELTRRSTDALAYRTIDAAAGGPAAPEIIGNELQALAACVFYRVPAVLYGSILVDTSASAYTALLKVYSRDSHGVVLEVRHAASAPSVSAFVGDLAAAAHQQLTLALLAGTPPVAAAAPQPAASPAAAAPEPGAAPPAAGPAAAPIPAASTESPAAPLLPPPLPSQPAAAFEPPSRAGLGLYTALGYFWGLQEEWSDLLLPRAMVQVGIKAGFSAFRGETLDFSMRSGLLFNYAFSTNKADQLAIHYHTLNPRIPLELCFGIGDRMNVWVGGGPGYRVDIIDYETTTRTFVSDMSFAVAAFAGVGVEVLVGKSRSIALGLSNELDVALFSERRIRNGVLASMTVTKPRK